MLRMDDLSKDFKDFTPVVFRGNAAAVSVPLVKRALSLSMLWPHDMHGHASPAVLDKRALLYP